MKRLLIAVLLIGFCVTALVYAQDTEVLSGERLALKSSLANKGLAKELKILEKVMYKKGAGRSEIAEAKMACIRLNESGLTPKEARKMLAKEVKKSMKQGIEGEALMERMQSMAQTRTRERVRTADGEKLQTREQLRDGTCEEVKEKIRENVPEGKTPELGSETGTGESIDTRKGR